MAFATLPQSVLAPTKWPHLWLMSEQGYEMNKKPGVARVFSPEAKLKRAVRAHFTKLGFAKGPDGALVLPDETKEVVRQLHSEQRLDKLASNKAFLERCQKFLLPHFANGAEIDPNKIKLRLKRVVSDTEWSDLFRFATLTWSVPVSAGFGRRMRYVVWDEGHNRIAGVIALGDPVFNLSVRDDLIGWSTKERTQRLVDILDAYVLGAVPPYNQLLGGKAVACLIRSREIYDDFRRSYGRSVGVISKKKKQARLLAITTTSSMGRSSVYNRLKIDGVTYFEPIGYTIGWGHFHITDKIFAAMRDFLRAKEHRYADQHKYGEGPNWRLRTIRAALVELGINQSVLKHGVKREVFLCKLASNAELILRSGKGKPEVSGLHSVAEISDLAVKRWMAPRAERDTSYKQWKREKIIDLVKGETTTMLKSKNEREMTARVSR